MATRYLSVDFGAGFEGLSTVAITIFNLDGTTHTARSTAGIAELGTSTGVYAGSISVGTGDDVFVLWDDGQATKTYAVARSGPEDDKISEIVRVSRLMNNTIKNQADFAGEINLRLAKMNNLTLDPNQIGQAFNDTLKNFDFGDVLKDSKMELSKLEDSNVKLIDQVIGIGAAGARTKEELKTLINEISPQMDGNTKKLTKAVSELGAALNSFMRDDVQKNIVNAIDGLQNRTGQALKLIGAEVQKDIATPILEAGQQGFQNQEKFLTQMKEMFSNFRDRFDKAIDMRSDIVGLSNQFTSQLSSLHTVFDAINSLTNQIRSIEDQIKQLKMAMGQSFRVLDGKVDVGNKIKVLPQFRGMS